MTIIPCEPDPLHAGTYQLEIISSQTGTYNLQLISTWVMRVWFTRLIPYYAMMRFLNFSNVQYIDYLDSGVYIIYGLSKWLVMYGMLQWDVFTLEFVFTLELLMHSN